MNFNSNEQTKEKFEVALTTKDNPFDPLEDFSNWLKFDMEKGYNSSAYLARIAKTSEALSDEENNAIIEQAIDEIISVDPFELYVKIKRKAE